MLDHTQTVLWCKRLNSIGETLLKVINSGNKKKCLAVQDLIVQTLKPFKTLVMYLI